MVDLGHGVNMKKEIIISGYGGQGVILSALLLCNAAMKQGDFVTFFPSYGAEMRGGTANSQIIISDNPIGSPVIKNPDILICFNELSYKRFCSKVKKQGLVFPNISLFVPDKDVDIENVEMPANKLAEECGSALAMNMIMLGALAQRTEIVKIENLINSVPQVLTEKKQNLWDINIKAIKCGAEFLRMHAFTHSRVHAST